MIIPLKPRAGTLVDRSLASAPTGAFYLFADGPNAPAADACGGAAAVPTGGVALGSGRFGPAVSFDGTTGFFNAGENPGIRDLALGPFTVAGWVQATNGGSRNLVTKDDAATTVGWAIVFSTATLRLTLGRSVSPQSATFSNPTAAGLWRHVAVVFDGVQAAATGHISLYLDGVKLTPTAQSAGSGTLATDAGNPLFIGRDGAAGATKFQGLVDHLLIDRRAYGPLEIQDLYANPFRNFAPSPLLFKQATTAKGAVTRLGLDGYGVRRTGSFAGKIPSAGGSIMPWPLFERMVA